MGIVVIDKKGNVENLVGNKKYLSIKETLKANKEELNKRGIIKNEK